MSDLTNLVFCECIRSPIFVSKRCGIRSFTNNEPFSTKIQSQMTMCRFGSLVFHELMSHDWCAYATYILFDLFLALYHSIPLSFHTKYGLDFDIKCVIFRIRCVRCICIITFVPRNA